MTLPSSSEHRKQTSTIDGSLAVPSRHPGRSLPMDMLRGVAILLVLGRHYVVAPDDTGWLQPFAAAWTTIGWAGVDLFFVLSGFLVGGLIFAEYSRRGTVDIRRFVIRRGFKIWPPYLAYIAVVAAWLAWQHSSGNLARVGAELWPNLLHVQNYFHTPRVHTWSLAVEEHFYLAVALVFYWLLCTRLPETAEAFTARRAAERRVPDALRHLPVFIVCCVIGLAVLRHLTFVRAGAADMNLYATHLRFDGLLIGTLLAYWTHFKPDVLEPLRRRPLTMMGVGVLLAAPTLALSPEANAWTAGLGLTGVYMGFALLMTGWLNVAGVHEGWRKAFCSRPAAWLGKVGFYSYSIYLWHVDLAQTPIKKVLQMVPAHDVSPAIIWPVAMGAYVVLAVSVGTVMARCLEIPSLALRDRLFPSVIKSGSMAGATNSVRPVAVVAPAVAAFGSGEPLIDTNRH